MLGLDFSYNKTTLVNLCQFFVNFCQFLSFRRKELTKEQEDYTFAQIGRVISDEWKKVEGEPLEKLKEEAERLNFEGVRKLPKDGSGNDKLLHTRIYGHLWWPFFSPFGYGKVWS